MAMPVAVQVVISFLGDGTSTTVTCDLEKDPYEVVAHEGNVVNWFSGQNKVATPTGVFSSSTGFEASLAGSIVTITFPVAPPAGNFSNVSVFVTF